MNVQFSVTQYLIVTLVSNKEKGKFRDFAYVQLVSNLQARIQSWLL